MQATVHSFVWVKLKAKCQMLGYPLLKQSFNQTISNLHQIVLTLQHKTMRLHLLQEHKHQQQELTLLLFKQQLLLP